MRSLLLFVLIATCAANHVLAQTPQQRVPWTTSRVQGSPEPASPYIAQPLYPKLKFDRPLDMAAWPLGGRWVVAEDPGLLHAFSKSASERAELFLDTRSKDPSGKVISDFRLWSFTFHPQFAENGYLYVCGSDFKARPAMSRIVRYQVDLKRQGDVPTCDPATAKVILEWPAREDHFGGCVKFGPDGYLYCPVGDGSGYADGNNSGQDLSDFNASVLRIDVDRTDGERQYRIPADNPFLKTPGAKPEIYAFGTRNIWRMSFDRATGDLWAGDVGQDLWEMILRVEKGGNYGWSVTEGTHPFRPERKVGPAPISPPVFEHDHADARSITGGFVYRGKRHNDLIGEYIYGDYDTGKIWGLRYDRDAKKVLRQRELVDTPLRIVGFAEDTDGELVIIDYTGTLHELAPRVIDPQAPAPEDFPRLLSQTGLFRDTARHEPATGVVPYSVNSPLWSDGAHKERFLAVPADKQIEYHPSDTWKLPEGSVLVKTFALDLEHGNQKSRRRLETRLLHLEQDHWRGYTYVWNDAQTDAELLTARGADQTFIVKDKSAPGGERKQVWHYPSRSECTLCHTMPVKFVLGVSTPQLNRLQDYAGKSRNQIDALAEMGLLANYTPPAREKLPDPHDTSASLNDRARSYLHANCAHCHTRWGGGNALFQLQYKMPLDGALIVNTPAMHGDFGIAGAKLVVPGEPKKSLLWHRMTLTERGRMPHVGSSVVDHDGVELIRQWIESLK